MTSGISSQGSHIIQKRPNAALHDTARLNSPLRKLHRPGLVAAAIVLDGGAVIGFDQAGPEALVAVQLDETFCVGRGGGCGCRVVGVGGVGGGRVVVVEEGPEVLDLGYAFVGLGYGCGGGGAEGAFAFEAPVVEEGGLAVGVGLEGAFFRAC